MAPKKGQSQEEKKSKLLEFFQKSHTFYTLKEVEKDGSKFTKISSMIIKEILLDLVNDGLVNIEKCGTTNLYWSFKLDEYKNLLNLQKVLKEKIFSLEEKKRSLLNELNQAKNNRKKEDDFGIRKDLLMKLKHQKIKNKELTEKLEISSNSDPETLEKIHISNQKLTEKINYLTDNIETLIYYFTKESDTPIDEHILRTELCIPSEFQDIPIDPYCIKNHIQN